MKSYFSFIVRVFLREIRIWYQQIPHRVVSGICVVSEGTTSIRRKMKVLLLKWTTQYKNKEALDNFATKKREESLISKPVSRGFRGLEFQICRRKTNPGWQINFKMEAKWVSIFLAGFEKISHGVFLANLTFKLLPCCILLLCIPQEIVEHLSPNTNWFVGSCVSAQLVRPYSTCVYVCVQWILHKIMAAAFADGKG